MNSLNLFLIIFLLYWLIVKYLDRKGLLEKHNITAYGPILMIRTQKGQLFLDKLAVYKRPWRLFANIGLPAMLIGMLVMFLLILFIDYSMIKSFQTHSVPPPSKFNEPRNIFLIPGVNEFIPLEWGIIALIVTLVVHEFAHAILSKVEGIRVKSMGILLALVPIGGFAEPDEEQLLGRKDETANKEEALDSVDKKIATRSERVRILTAGVMANFVTALIAFILFFSLLGSLSSVGDVMVTDVIPGSPAEQAGIRPDMILTGIDNLKVKSAHDFLFYVKTLEPGTKIKLYLDDQKTKKEVTILTTSAKETHPGVIIYDIIKGSPAESSGIKAGMVLVKINNTEINELDDFIEFMSSSVAGQKIDVHVLSDKSAEATILLFKNVELARYPYDPEAKKGFLGVSYSPKEGAISHSTGIEIGQFPATNYLNGLKAVPSMLTGITGWVLLFGLPLFGGPGGEVFTGFTGIITNFYDNTGWAAGLGMDIFWILSVLLWIGWMNFYVGLFNCLPAVPLDGGHVFRDVMTSFLSRIMGDGERVEGIANTIVVLFAVLILMSLIFVMVAPYAAHGF